MSLILLIVFDKLQKLKWVDALLIMGIMLIITGIGMSLKMEKNSAKQNIKMEVITKIPTITIQKEVQVDIKVTVDVSGEVVKPGVYKLKKGDRVGDVLIMAGGLSAKADREWVDKNINRAEIIRDGEKIYIPKSGEKNANYELLITNNKTKELQIININTAGVEELDKLSGIGPSIAQKIIDYRESNGGFKTKEELKLVPGIGDKLFEQIKEKITF